MEIDFPAREKGESVLSEKQTDRVIRIAILLAILLGGPLKPAAVPFRALPMDSLESEAAFFQSRLAASEKTLAPKPLSVEDRFRLLTLARSYQAQGLYEISESWFRKLGEYDPGHDYEDAVFNGMLQCALCRGDWDRAERMLGLDNRRGIELDESSVLRLVGHLKSEKRRARALEILDGIFAEPALNGTARLMLAKGTLLRESGRLQEAADFYENILNRMKVADSVHTTILAREDEIRRAAADCAFLLNDRLHARSYYALLEGSSRSDIRNWARFQLAQLDMLDNGYRQAESVFASFGPDSLSSSMSAWAVYLREHARKMQSFVDLLPDNRPPGEAEGGK